jgi:hypothetical protein
VASETLGPDAWRSSPLGSTKQAQILRVFRPERIWCVRRGGAVESSCPKLSRTQPSEAQGLAGRHRLGQWGGGLARRLVTWRYRARCWRVWVRTCGHSSEKRTARFFKRILRHSIGLFHLGLLSPRGSRCDQPPAHHPTVSKQGPRGLARGPWTKIFPIPSSGLPLHVPARIRRIHARRFDCKKCLIFNILRARDWLHCFTAFAARLRRALRTRIVQFSDRTFHPSRRPRSTHPIGLGRACAI